MTSSNRTCARPLKGVMGRGEPADRARAGARREMANVGVIEELDAIDFEVALVLSHVERMT